MTWDSVEQVIEQQYERERSVADAVRGWCKECGGLLIWIAAAGAWNHELQYNDERGAHLPVMGDMTVDKVRNADALQVAASRAYQLAAGGSGVMGLADGTKGNAGRDQVEYFKHRLATEPNWANLVSVKWAQVVACPPAGDGRDRALRDSLRGSLAEVMAVCYAWYQALDEREGEADRRTGQDG